MTAPIFQYHVYHPVSRARMGYLDVREAKWTEVINGGTTFSGKVTVPDNSIVATNIKTNTTPHASAIYATPGDGSIRFGGPIIDRTWDGESNSLAFTAIDWKSWFYRIVLGPSTTGLDPWVQTFSSVDQLTIAKAMIDRASALYNNGTPSIETGNYTTGVNRNYIVAGIEFKTLGAHLDELGSLSNGGYEWEVEPYFASDGLPMIRVQFYIPERGGVITGLKFSKTPQGGNILRIEEMTDDSTSMANRVWAVGEGPNAESTPWACDEDPLLALASSSLRSDQVSQYSGALTRAQLASYARTERAYRSNFLSGLSFLVRMDNPELDTYGKGDRCRIVVQDRFLDVDASNCRILSREMRPDDNTIKLTVNLNDLTAPTVDSGGSV